MKKQLTGLLVLQFLSFVTFGQQILHKELQASRIVSPPKLDGFLSDSCWMNAAIAGDFVTQLPQPGLKMPQATEVKVLYTQEALYIGFYCRDNAPDSILKQLTGRDTEGNSDWCSIIINCYQDGINGLMFAISPNGEQWDGKMLGTEEPDVSWNAVWDCKTKIVNDGWCAEFKIPFAAIRFPDIPIQQWDINFGREIRRHRIIGTWNPVDPNGPGDLVQMGVLKGVEHVQPPKRIFFFPYTSGYYNFGSSGNNFSYNLGLDLKLGLGDAFTLDATLIPDFGQTISDQLILNLTPFEIQFQDNRQFFMEGTELFNKTGIFYSRRIGGEPIGVYGASNQMKEDERLVSNPMQSQIINSVKISGRTKGNLGIGVMNSVTAPTFATFENESGEQRSVETQPLANYNVLVLDQNLKNNSFINFTNTNVTRLGSAYDANVSGYSMEIKDKENQFSISSNGAFSHLSGRQAFAQNGFVQNGFAQGTSVNKIRGNFLGKVGYYMESDTYDPNDMGFLQANNSFSQFVSLAYNLYQPFGPFNRMWSSLDIARESLYNPMAFTRLEMDAELGLNTKNFTTYNISVHGEPVRGVDYFEPRVWGMKFRDFRHIEVGGWISTDYRKQLAIDVGGRYGKFENAGREIINARFSPRYRINDHWMLIYIYSLQQHFNDVGFSNFDEKFKPKTPIFGRRDVISHTNVLTVNCAINPLMSINCRFRHYWGYSRYHEFFELESSGELWKSSYQPTASVNRNFNTFTIDCFFRWNFTPGSYCIVGYKWDQTDENNLIPSGLWEDMNNTVNDIPIAGNTSVRLIYFLDYRLLTKNKGEAIGKFM